MGRGRCALRLAAFACLLATSCRAAPPDVEGRDTSGVPTTVTRLEAPTPTLWPSVTPSATPRPTFPADAIVQVASLNLRTGPDTLHPVVDVLTVGTAVALRGRSHDDLWLAVLSPDLQEGWLSAQHVRLRRELETVPTMITPTPPATRTPTPVPADPAQSLVLAPPVVAQGDPVLVRLRSPGSVQVVAGLADATVPMHRTSDETLAGLLPVPVDLPAGEHEVHVTAVDAAGNPTDHVVSLAVRAVDFDAESLTLADESAALLDVEAHQAELDLLADRVWTVEGPERLWVGAWQRPVTTSISSAFGALRSYNEHETAGRHAGVDLRGAVGRAVVAPAAGRVVLAEALAVHGNTVWLDHGWGVQSGYAHLDAIAVETGDLVAAGEPLGTVGRTGRVTGPHLHWEVRIAGVAVQPIEFLLRDVGAVP